jgi:predicted ATPase/DNA-binding CsgD family transcriptional regulator
VARSGSRTGNLPAPATSFVGRRDELAGARDLIAGYRLTTLTGPGGVGKTRLALEIAAAVAPAFPDGAWLVELADLRDPGDVAEALVAALGIGGATPTGALAELTSYVASRSLLLVVDNCEHVLPGCQALIDRLLRAAPDLRVLATSRQPLGLAAEHIVDVHPLPVPEASQSLNADEARQYGALALLEDRTAQISPGFALTDANLAAAARLCARLDGIPLAIELAAARLRALSVEQLLTRLDDRFATLTGGDPTAGERHRTLRGLVEWSADLCSAGERTMWARASVFAGGFDLDAAESVCADEQLTADQVLDLVDGLVAKSILLPESGSDRVRYRLLETLAEHGRERLEAAGETAGLRSRHAAYYSGLAAAAAAGFWTHDQQRWLLRTRAEHANLALAFDHLMQTDPHAALRLAAHLRFYWVTGGVLREGRRWLERALDATAPELRDPKLRAEALWTCAWVAVLQGDYAAVARRLAECDDLADRHGLPAAGAHAATWRGTLELFSGDLACALAQFELAAGLHTQSGDVEGALMTLFQLGVTASLLGDGERARTACADALKLSESVGESFAGSYALWVLAHDAWSTGRLDEAEDLARRALRFKYEQFDTIGIPLVAEVLGSVLVSRGEVAEGARVLGVAAAIWEAAGTRMNAFGPALAATHDRSAARAREVLGEAPFAAAVEAGRTLAAAAGRALLLGEALPGEDAADAGADELSPRELQVAQMVSRGMSNKDIAGALVLSTRTVEGHVQRILTKLGFKSRVEIGLWARDR